MKKLLKNCVMVMVLSLLLHTTLPFVFSESISEGAVNNYVYGDLSGDGVVDTGDYLFLRMYLLEIRDSFPNSEWKVVSDLNMDGSIDTGDYLLLKSFLLNRITELPVVIPTTHVSITISPTFTNTPTYTVTPTKVITVTKTPTSTPTKVFTTTIAPTLTTSLSIYIAGDSTASYYAPTRAPRAGWGQVIGNLFNTNVAVSNQAASGRSSKSFIDEGRLTTILSTIKKGDYLFIQFGHNDEKSDTSLHTDPYTTYKTYLKQYIDGAKNKGANPVLLTSLGRRKFDSNNLFYSDHGEYPAAMKQLAQEENVPVIDMTKKSIDYYNKIGVEATKKVFLWLDPGVSPNYPNGVQDSTHFCEYGATEVSKHIIEGINELNLPLRNYIK